jgi:ribosomal protein L37AE/L43A
MASNSDRSRRELSHFHACVHCGNVARRDEFDGAAVATGIYPCAKCGQDGPLNIVIRDVDAAATSTSRPASSNSAG